MEDIDVLMALCQPGKGGTRFAINKWIVQVITDKGCFVEYHAAPPVGTPAIIHSTPLNALRAAVAAERIAPMPEKEPK